MQNTDTCYPFSFFFEIILPFFRNYLYMGWKFLRQIVPGKIDINSLRKEYFASGTYTLSLYTQVTIIISLFLSLSPLSFATFSHKSKKNQIPPLLKNQNKLASLIYLGGNSRGPRFEPSISNGWGSSRGCGSEQQTSSLGWSWKNFSSSLRQGKHGCWWNCHHGQSCVRLLNPVKFGQNYPVWHLN